jgi:transcriptional regulator with XRE-family HTH domain
MWTARTLKTARRRAGLTQRELASRAGVPYSTVARIESGTIDPRASTLRALLVRCGVDLEPMPAIGDGVDRSQIRERLALTPAERIRDLTTAAAAVVRLHGRARRQR